MTPDQVQHKLKHEPKCLTYDDPLDNKLAERKENTDKIDWSSVVHVHLVQPKEEKDDKTKEKEEEDAILKEAGV